MTAPTTSTEVTEYLARVRAALADLPAEERDELLDELSTHLDEVSAETGRPLSESLGSPEEYAAELRASAGLAPAARPDRWQFVRTALADSPRLRQLAAFLGELKPAWWVARGYLFAAGVTAVFAGGGFDGLFPMNGVFLPFVVFALVSIAASVWVGRRTARLSVWPRRLVVAAGIFLALLGYIAWAGARSDYASAAYYGGSPLDGVSNIQVYDANGQRVSDVRLFDQDGNPIELPWQCGTDVPPRYTADGSEARNVYPYLLQLPDGTQCYVSSRPAAERIAPLATGAPTPGEAPPSGAATDPSAATSPGASTATSTGPSAPAGAAPATPAPSASR